MQPLELLFDHSELARMNVRRPELAVFGNSLGEQRRLLAATRAGIEHALARTRPDSERNQLRAFFLHDEDAFSVTLALSRIAAADEARERHQQAARRAVQPVG